jgi:hypothetical protein
MGTVIVISVAAVLVAIVGCAVIWGYDLARSREIEQDRQRLESREPAVSRAPVD